MAGGIWGDGQRGGIFGARIDPRLQAELERRAALKRQEMAAAEKPSTLSSRAADWWNKSNFFKPAYDELVGGATMFGDVMSGAQPTMAADPQTGEFHTDPRLADRAMNAAGMLTLGAGAIPAEANSLRMGIKAYHGSPHNFERFDASKIGTGEGAQAYGHGLYLAESEKVAEQYRKNLSYKQVVRDFRDALPDDADFTEVNSLVGTGHFTPYQDRVLKALKADDWLGFDYPSQAISAAYRELDNFDPSPELRDAIKQSGNMYEVDIAADPEHFLDWDKPLSEQPEAVRKAYAKAVAGDDPIARELLDESPESMRMAGLFSKSSGAQAYNTLARSRQRDVSLKNAPLASPQQQKGWDVLASQALHEAGVPGIKYLDQGSRGAVDVANIRGTISMLEVAARKYPNDTNLQQQLAGVRQQLADAEKGQTRNYVVFSDDLIKILRKYGIPIGALGATGAALSDKKEQPPGL